MFVYSKGFLSAVLLLLVLQVPAVAFGESSFDRIVFFGDSLSDPGNAFVITGQVSLRPFEPIPDFPYAIGGKHFSNGKTWAEVFAARLRRNRSAKPALRVPGVFTNYAVGASRARLGGSPFSLPVQVGLYGQDFATASADHLYVIFFGGNDIRDALAALASDPSGVTSAGILADAVTAIAGSIIELTDRGAEQFLVANAPDVGLAPAVTALGPEASFAGTLLSTQFNEALEGALFGLESTLPITIKRLNVFDFIRAAVAAPEAFGFTDVTSPCLTFFTVVRPFCSKPRNYLFWDAIHPTRAGHWFLAELALESVN